MPTRGRPEFAARAAECFDAQDWHQKELVIADDARSPSFPRGIEREDIQYFRVTGIEIGGRRNLCCSRSQGEVIVHFDDDDFSAPSRITDQVRRLIDSGKSVTGYNSMEFRGNGERWMFRNGPEATLGTSLCYLRSWWLHHPFPSLQIGEDGDFVRVAHAAGQLTAVDAGELMYATNHPGNTSPRQLTGSNWRRIG